VGIGARIRTNLNKKECNRLDMVDVLDDVSSTNVKLVRVDGGIVIETLNPVVDRKLKQWC